MLGGVDYQGSTAAVLVGAVVFLFLWLVRTPRGIPPGPRFRFPVLGHLPLMRGDFLEKLRRMRAAYGDIFHLYLGSHLVVVLNGYDVIREALVKHGDVFSERPHTFTFDVIAEGSGIVFSSGRVWREHRKFAMGALKNLGLGKNFLQEKILEEASELLAAIEEECSQPLYLLPLVQTAVCNVLNNILMNKRFHYRDAQLRKFLHCLNENFRLAGNGLADWFPFLARLPGDPVNFRAIWRNQMVLKEELVLPAVAEHKEKDEDEEESDFLDAYLKKMRRKEKKGAPTCITEEHLWRVIIDLFAAGTETSSTTILWAVLHLQNDLDLQERLYKDIHEKVGRGRPPVLEDRPELPFLEAFILEVLRHSDVAPLAVPHGVTSDVIFRGYVIPRDAMVIVHLDSVLKDPTVWKDPDVFRPERFLQDGRVVKPEEFIPFSTGRRACLGESLAKMELFLFLTAMIQRFRFEPPDHGPPPEMKGIRGLSHAPVPFEVKVTPRI